MDLKEFKAGTATVVLFPKGESAKLQAESILMGRHVADDAGEKL